MRSKQVVTQKDTKACPRCGSYRTYSSDEEFICMGCSYISIRR